MLVQRYNHLLGAVTSIVHLLPHFEHLAAPMAQLMEVFVNDFGCTRAVAEIARLVCFWIININIKLINYYLLTYLPPQSPRAPRPDCAGR